MSNVSAIARMILNTIDPDNTVVKGVGGGYFTIDTDTVTTFCPSEKDVLDAFTFVTFTVDGDGIKDIRTDVIGLAEFAAHVGFAAAGDHVMPSVAQGLRTDPHFRMDVTQELDQRV